ncbi:hypothetical protein BH11ACT8_BH11ACT8_15420 [soil metagenome]
MAESPHSGLEPAPRVGIQPTLRVGSGSHAVLEVLITNTSAEPRLFAVLALGVDSGWLPGPLRTPVLAAGESTVLELPVSPPAGTLPARYPLAVSVQALVPGAVPGAERAAASPPGLGESLVVVNPRAQVSLEVEPARSTLVRSQRLRVTVRNGGATAARVDLSDTTTRGLEVRLRSRSLEVPAGGEVQVRGRLVATRPRRVGAAVDHSWSLTATSAEVVRQARGTVHQRPVVAGSLMRGMAVLLVVAIWVGAAIVGLPKVIDRFGGKDDQITAATVNGDGAGGEADPGAADPGAADPGAADPGAEDPAAGDANDAAKGVLVNGTIEAEDPSDFRVRLTPTSLFGPADANQQTPPAAEVALAAYGKIPQTTVLSAAPAATERLATPVTKPDGVWAIPRVHAPGYYLLTITKPGFATKKYLIDSSDPKAGEPRKIAMVPGRGSLSGVVTGPAGRVGAASVTVTDGTNTLTTSSGSLGSARGQWSLDGLDAPGTYVVQVSSPGLGSESRLVRIGADGVSRVDLHLVRGLVSLSGQVRGRLTENKVQGLPGITVTVEDGQGAARTTATVSAATGDANEVTGSFVLAGLPTPGTYTVTLSGAGFETQTREIELRKGELPDPIDAFLPRATGSVGGVLKLSATSSDAVLDPRGAGLVLSNDTDTYKTQVGGRSGAFLISGVTPGAYQLTTTLFGFTTNVQTVLVRADKVAAANPRLAFLEGGVISSGALIKGGVVEANIGDYVTCVPLDSKCVTAEVSGEGADPATMPDLTTRIARDGTFTLPGAGGLKPGLYTVAVNAPGYETSLVQVQLAQDEIKTLADTELFRKPVISGRITTVIGQPSGTTCVWAVPVTTSSDDVQACADVTAASCPPATDYDPYTPTADPPLFDDGRVCTQVDGAGDYTLQVPRRGDYKIIVEPTDSEYPAPTRPGRITAPVGGSVVYNVQLNRLARLTLRVLKAGASGALAPAVGATVVLRYVEADTSQTMTVPATATPSLPLGAVRFTGLLPGDYEIFGSSGGYKNDPSPDTITLGLDQEISRIVPLVDKVDQVTGRVTSNVTGTAMPVVGATATITAPTGYTDTTPVSTTATMTSNADGCFAVIKPPDTVASPTGACTSLIEGDSVFNATFVSRTATEVTIAADGYDTLVLSNRALSTSLNPFVLDPTPVPFSGTITANPAAPASFDWSRVAFRVESSTSQVSGITVRADVGGALTWSDSRYGSQLIRPGTYTVTPSLSGYTGVPATLTCGVSAPGCQLTGLRLDEFGSLMVTTVSSNGGGPVNATVTLYRGGDLVGTRTATGGGNSVTFANLAPGDGKYTLRLRALGFAFVDDDRDPDVSLSCSQASTADPLATAMVNVTAGTLNDCTATLNRLPSLTGTVRGIQGTSPAAQSTNLVGATVSAAPCTAPAAGGTCPPNADRRRVVTTGAEGDYSLGSTDTFEGFTTGQWLLTATLAGWSQPSGTSGTVVAVVEGGADLVQDLTLYVQPVQFTVRVKDGYGLPVTDARATLTAGTTTINQDADPAVGPKNGADGGYVFSDVIPSFYVLTVSSPDLITSTFQVEVRVGSGAQEFPVFVSRGSNAVQGTVTAEGRGLAGAAVSVVACAPTCGTDTATGTDGELLEATSNAQGAFGFTTVPDGFFAFRVVKTGYTTVTGPSLDFNHNRPQNPQVIDLLPGSATVVVSLNGSVATDTDLKDSGVVIVPVASSGYPAPVVVPTATGGSTSRTFSTVRYGCWTVQVTLPALHYGTITYPTASSAGLGCTGAFVVPAGGSAATIQVGVTITETELQIGVTTHAEHPQPPTSSTVTVTGGGLSGALPVAFATSGDTGPVTRKSIWVPPGGYTVRAVPVDAPLTYSPVFWPPQEVSVTAAGSSTNATVALVEQTSALTVSVNNLPGATGASTITVTPGAGQTATVPTAYGPTCSGAGANACVSVPDGGSAVLTLPSGPWIITATPDPATGSPDQATVTLTARTATQTLRPKPPADPGPGTGGP